MALKSKEARIVKMADVISNLRAIAVSPPAGWSAERKLGYLEGCRQLVDAGRCTEATIERIFDETAADVECAIRDDAPFSIDGREVVVRLARLCISSICPIPRAALLKPPMLTAYAGSSGRDSPRLQFSPPRQFTRAKDDRFSWPVLKLTAQMPSLISLSASVSLSIINLSESRSEDGISEFMETIPDSGPRT
jgi:hypothetical protein